MSDHSILIRNEDDIYVALYYVRNLMRKQSFSEMDQQKVLVSVSELTRNVLNHAGTDGVFSLDAINGGICFSVTDKGKGIKDVEEIFSGSRRKSAHGLGLGLAGARRLMDEFNIETSDKGTKITAIKWKG